MPGSADAARALAARLSSHLAALPVEAAVLEAVRQGAGAADAAEALALLAADPESCEHAPLVALLLSPGREVRLALEPLLQRLRLDAAGTRELARATAARVAGRVGLLLPEGEAPLALAMRDWAPDWAVQGFVLRLRPEATPPEELLAILRRRLDETDPTPEAALALAVQLRHARLTWSPTRRFLAASLLERARPDELMELLAWTLGFLDLAGEGFEPRAALGKRRRELTAMLRLAESGEPARAGGSMEFLQSQGLRLGHVHGPDVLAGLERLDRVARLCLGLDGEALDGFAVRDLGAVADPDGLTAEELARLLG